MSSDREVNRIVRSWLEQGVTTLPDRVLDNVLDQLPATPQRRALWPARRFNPMNTGRIAIAAAAIVVAAVVGINLMPGQGVGSGPSAAPTPSPTASPSPVSTALPLSGRLAPGTNVIDSPFPLRVSMVVGEGWNVWTGTTSQGAAIYKHSFDPPNGIGVIVVIVENLYSNACETDEGLLDPPLGPGVDDLADALAAQPGTEASDISDVTLNGHSGKYLEYTATGFGTADCPATEVLHRWPTVAGPRQALENEHDKVWILDVDGMRLVIDAFSFPGATPADHAELRAIVDSIQIE